MRFTQHFILRGIIIFMLCGTVYGSAVFAQSGTGPQHATIRRDTASELALVGTFGRGLVHALAWSSDGAYLAAAATNGTYIYDAAHWDVPPQALPAYGEAVENVIWRPGTYELVTIHAQGALFRWDLIDGTFQRVPDIDLDTSNVLLTAGRDKRTTHDLLAFTADGSLYDVLGPYEGRLEFRYPCSEYDICIHDVLHKVNIPVDSAGRTAVLSDGTVISLNLRTAVSATGLITAGIPRTTSDGSPAPTSYVALWDSAGNAVGTIETGFTIPKYGASNAPDRIALNPNGSLLAAGGCTWTDESHGFCQQYTVRVFDVASGQVAFEPKEKFTLLVTSLVFSPDGLQLAAADGRSVRVWDVASSALQTTLIGYGGGGALVAHPSLPVLFEGGAGITVWDTTTPNSIKPIASLPSSSPIALSPDGQWLVAGNVGTYYLGEITYPTLWNVSNPAAPYAVTELNDLTRTQQVDDITFSPDGTYLVVTTENNIDTGHALHRHRELQVFETDGFSLVASTVDNFPVQPSFSLDGRWFVFGVMSPTVTVMAYPTARLSEGGALFAEEPYLAFEQSGFVFPPQSDYALLFVEPAREVQIWDMEAKVQVGVDDKRPFWAGTYNADGSLIVIGDTLYDTTTYDTLWQASQRGGGATFSADEQYLFLRSYTPDNALYVSHDSLIQVYAIPTSPDEIYDLPPRAPYPVHCGGQAEVYVLDNDTLNVRAAASVAGDILTKLESGTSVDIVDEQFCFEYDGQYVWLHIRTQAGIEGWAVMFADGIQTLLQVD